MQEQQVTGSSGMKLETVLTPHRDAFPQLERTATEFVLQASGFVPEGDKWYKPDADADLKELAVTTATDGTTVTLADGKILPAYNLMAQLLVGDSRAISYPQLVTCVINKLVPLATAREIHGKSPASADKLKRVVEFLEKLPDVQQQGETGLTEAVMLSEERADVTDVAQEVVSSNTVADSPSAQAEIDLVAIATQIRLSVRKSEGNDLWVGKTLLTVKKELSHGKFADWIRDSQLGIDVRTSQNYMALARFSTVLSGESVSYLDDGTVFFDRVAAYRLGAEKVPELAIRDAISWIRDGKYLTTADAKRIIAQYVVRAASRKTTPGTALKNVETLNDILTLAKKADKGTRMGKKLESITPYLMHYVKARDSGDSAAADEQVRLLLITLL